MPVTVAVQTGGEASDQAGAAAEVPAEAAVTVAEGSGEKAPEALKPADPEEPLSPPKESDLVTGSIENGAVILPGGSQAETQDASAGEPTAGLSAGEQTGIRPQQGAEEALPPLIPDDSAGQTAETAESSGGDGAGAPAESEALASGSGGKTAGKPDHRNLEKYPYFSKTYPSRRLNMPGDPNAVAPIPGERIYPEEPQEGSAILHHMLTGD